MTPAVENYVCRGSPRNQDGLPVLRRRVAVEAHGPVSPLPLRVLHPGHTSLSLSHPLSFTPLLILLLLVAPQCTLSYNADTDKRALLKFKQAVTSDPQGYLASWTAATPVCQFNGVTCSSQGRVAGLALSNAGITGSLPKELGHLNRLQSLAADSNNLWGSLPANVGQLQQLSYLRLSFNALTGPIHFNYTRLRSIAHLALDGNSLSGPIPDRIYRLPGLSYLNLNVNYLEGSVPQTANMYATSLAVLDVGVNNLQGSVPTALATLSSLVELDLHCNELRGALPSQLAWLDRLTYLDLSGNRFVGCLPHNWGNMSSLQVGGWWGVGGWGWGGGRGGGDGMCATHCVRVLSGRYRPWFSRVCGHSCP